MTVYFNIDRDRYTGALQLSVSEINDKGMGIGRRIAGPKYAGDSTSLLAQEIGKEDAEAIIEVLRKAQPKSISATMTTTAPDPLVEAIVRLLTRHHNGCDHPVQPAPWMRNAATEIAECLHHISFALSPWDEVLMEGPFIDLCELAPELDRRADA